MEVKKTHSANLENKRVTNYLLGLVVVLSFLFVALEYNSNSRTFDFDDEVPDDFFEEMEILPDVEKSEMVAAAIPTAAPSITTKIKAVDTPVALPDKLNERNDEEKEGEEATVQQNETPTTAIEQPVPEPIASDDKPRVVQQMPEYPGGIVEFMKWLQRTLRYPPTAQEQGIYRQCRRNHYRPKGGSRRKRRLRCRGSARYQPHAQVETWARQGQTMPHALCHTYRI